MADASRQAARRCGRPRRTRSPRAPRPTPSVARGDDADLGRQDRPIELLVADTLDLPGEPAVVVLAPTRALVSQLAHDLHRVLPGEATVRASHGGLDFDTDTPGHGGRHRGAGCGRDYPNGSTWSGVASSQATAASPSSTSRLLRSTRRTCCPRPGAEPGLSSRSRGRFASRTRVVLLSSQFPNPRELGAWLGTASIESRAFTWLRRFVYYQSEDKSVGSLREELHCSARPDPQAEQP